MASKCFERGFPLPFMTHHLLLSSVSSCRPLRNAFALRNPTFSHFTFLDLVPSVSSPPDVELPYHPWAARTRAPPHRLINSIAGNAARVAGCPSRCAHPISRIVNSPDLTSKMPSWLPFKSFRPTRTIRRNVNRFFSLWRFLNNCWLPNVAHHRAL
jgi:hypothetical protein